MGKNFLILGYFGYVTNLLGGQTVKTRNVYELLKTKSMFLGTVDHFDFQQFQFNKLSPFKMIFQICRCRKLVYLPSHNNLKYVFPIVYFICALKRIDIIYIVIGGWLAEYLETKKLHAILLSRIKAIFPENKYLKDKLEKKYGFKNVTILPNFRINSFIPFFKQGERPFKIVFMARINRMKGIDSVFRLAEKIAKNSFKTHRPILIDFYGPIEKSEEDYFKAQIDKFDFVKYHGTLEPEEIYKTLGEYDVLVLPTKYSREGFPGSILDAYISGIPAVVSNWEYATEVIDHGKTGFIFDLNDEKEFYEYVYKLYSDQDLLLQMKRNAYEKSKIFSSENAWEIIKKELI